MSECEHTDTITYGSDVTWCRYCGALFVDDWKKPMDRWRKSENKQIDELSIRVRAIENMLVRVRNAAM